MKKQKENIEENFIEKDPFLKRIEKQEERGIVKIGFNDSSISIKKAKKPSYKPQESEIQREIMPKIPKPTELEKDGVLCDLNEINQLEKEIKEKKRLLKQKKIEEKIKKIEEEKKQKEIEVPQEITGLDEIKEIKLEIENDKLIKICPECSSDKIKRGKVMKDGFVLQQYFKCKKCDYKKEIILEI